MNTDQVESGEDMDVERRKSVDAVRALARDPHLGHSSHRD